MADNTNDLPAPDIFATIPKEETATIIVPLYEMTKDSLVPVITHEMLQVALLRLRSFFHKSYLVFVGESGRTTNEALAVVQGHLAAHNAVYTEIEQFSSFGMYLQAGLKAGLEQTESKYFIFATPWQMVGSSSVDVLLERINRIDIAMCSGFDTRLPVPSIGYEGVSPADFDSVKFNPPREFLGIDVNFFGMTKTIADTLQFDPTYSTRSMLQQDLFQVLKSRQSYAAITQQVPIYTFDIDWSPIEDEQAISADKEYFKSKWGFLPG